MFDSYVGDRLATTSWSWCVLMEAKAEIPINPGRLDKEVMIGWQRTIAGPLLLPFSTPFGIDDLAFLQTAHLVHLRRGRDGSRGREETECMLRVV